MTRSSIDYSSIPIAKLTFVPIITEEQLEANQGLFDAVYSGDNQLAEDFINQGADINQIDESGWTLLMEATRNNDVKIIELLLKKNPDVNQKENILGVTALIVAASFNAKKAAETLIRNGSDVNIVSDSGMTALEVAASKNFEDVINSIINLTIRCNAFENLEQRQAFFNQLKNVSVKRNLDQESVTLLAVNLEDEELKNSIIENYNSRFEESLDEEWESEVDKLKNLRNFLTEVSFKRTNDYNLAHGESSSVIASLIRNERFKKALDYYQNPQNNSRNKNPLATKTWFRDLSDDEKNSVEKIFVPAEEVLTPSLLNFRIEEIRKLISDEISAHY